MVNGGMPFNQARLYRFNGVKVSVRPSFITDINVDAIFRIPKISRIYLHKQYLYHVFSVPQQLSISFVPAFFFLPFFVLFHPILWIGWNNNQFIASKMKWINEESKKHSVNERLIFFFVQISSICCLIYLMSWYKSRHFPFRSISTYRIYSSFVSAHCLSLSLCIVSYLKRRGCQRPRIYQT